MKASACHHTLHANHWHCLWNISPIIAVKSNVTTSIKVLRFVVNMFIVVGLRLPYLNTPILKAWGSTSRAQRPLTTGIVRRQFPSLRGTTWRNNGRSAALASSTYAPFTRRLLTFTGCNWKCHVIIGLVRTVRQIHRATPSGFDFLFRTRPRALGQQTPPEPVLIP